MSGPDAPNLDAPQVGRPQLSAVREPLARSLSDLLYEVGGQLMIASRLVERRLVEDYLGQGTTIGEALLRILLLHGQLAVLDELQGGKLHGHSRPEFPEPDAAVAERLASFRATRALEQTQQRPWSLPDEDGLDDPA